MSSKSSRLTQPNHPSPVIVYLPVVFGVLVGFVVLDGVSSAEGAGVIGDVRVVIGGVLGLIVSDAVSVAEDELLVGGVVDSVSFFSLEQ